HAKDRADRPAADHSVKDRIVYRELAPLPHRQVVSPEGLQHMADVEGRRSVIQPPIAQRGEIPDVVHVLVVAVIQRVRQGVIHVYRQPVRQPLAELYLQGVVVGKRIVAQYIGIANEGIEPEQIDRILSWRVEPQAGARAEAIADKTAEISRGRGEGIGQRPGLTGLKLGDESGVSETLSGGQAYERGVENGRRGLPGQIVVGESLSTPVGDVNIEVPPRLNELIQESVLDDVGLVNVKGM